LDLPCSLKLFFMRLLTQSDISFCQKLMKNRYQKDNKNRYRKALQAVQVESSAWTSSSESIVPSSCDWKKNADLILRDTPTNKSNNLVKVKIN